jgi:hypothetical protein
VLAEAARKRSASPPAGQATHTSTVLAATQAVLARQGSATIGPQTLGEIKALLMEAMPDPGLLKAGPDRKLQQNALLLLPLHLLNASRPRTPCGLTQALDRLQLLRASVALP